MTRFVCHPCGVALTADDREHYLYHCHDCAMREHDLILAVRRDPDHPEAALLEHSLVEFDTRRPDLPATRRTRSVQPPSGLAGGTGARLSASSRWRSSSRRRRSAS